MLTGRHRPDPAEWCPRGYAIVNVDIRGTWDSEGDLYIEGSQMGTLLLSSRARIDPVLIDNC
jgi:predicted acyl esterase